MSDLISRKAAIEAMEQRYCDIERVKKRPVTKGEQAIFLDMRGVVRSLPSWGCRMGDLISRQDAIEVLTETIAPPSVTLDTLVMRIDALPSAEAVQGEWIDIDNYYRMATCSHCHKVTMFEKWGEYTRPYNFCPNCGAKMTKGGDSE